MGIEADIYERLAGDVYDLVSGRVYATDPVNGATLPFIYYRVVSTAPEMSLSGPCRIANYTLAVSTLAQSLDTATEIADAVAGQLHSYQGESILGSWLTDQTSEPIGDDTEGDVYHVAQVYTVWASTTQGTNRIELPIGSDAVVTLFGLRDSVSGQYVNDAEAEGTLYEEDGATEVTTFTLDYVADSNGIYRGTIEDAVTSTLTVGTRYKIKVVATDPPDTVLTIWRDAIAISG